MARSLPRPIVCPPHRHISIDVRENPPRHQLAILVPILAVLFLASLIVANLAVDKEDQEVDDVHVDEGRLEATGEGPGQTHDEVAHIVWVTAATPPA